MLAAFYAALTTLATIIVLQVNHKSNKEKPSSWFQTLMRRTERWIFCQCRLCRRSQRNNYRSDNSSIATSSTHYSEQSQSNHSTSHHSTSNSHHLFNFELSGRNSVNLSDRQRSQQGQQQEFTTTERCEERHHQPNGNFSSRQHYIDNDRNHVTTSENSSVSDNVYDWQHYSVILDKLFFWLFLTINVITALVCLVFIPLSK